MKKIILVISLVGMYLYTYAQDGIRFMDYKGTSFEQVLAKAQQENKIVFVDIWTKWCGPCKLLKAKTFTDPEVAGFFNKHFVNLDFDAEDPNWVKIAEKYYATAFPTLLFINPQGDVIWSVENLQIGMNDKEGKPVARHHLIEQAQLVLDYDTLPINQFFTTHNWKRICKYGSNSSNEIFKTIITHKGELEREYGSAVSQQIKRSLNHDAANIFRKSSNGYVLNQEKYDYIKTASSCLGKQEQAAIVLEMDIDIAMQAKNWQKATDLIEKGFTNGLLTIESRAWYANSYTECDIPDLKAKARMWVEEAIKIRKGNERLQELIKTLSE